MDAKISVVVPAYNATKYLEECLLSIRKQTRLPDEVIILDDGSTDFTSAIGRYFWFKDSRFKVHSYYPNRGVGFARNQGAKLAHGDFICYLSADDCYEPKYLETMLRYAEPESFLFSDYYVCNEVLQPRSVLNVPKFDDQKQLRELCLCWALQKNMFVNFSSIMIHKDVFDKVGFREDVRYGEDLVFLLEMLVHGVKGIHISESLLRYRVHKGAGTFCLSFEKWLKIWTEITPLLVKLGVDKATINRSMSSSYRLSFNPLMKLKRIIYRRLPKTVHNKRLKSVWKQVNSYVVNL